MDPKIVDVIITMTYCVVLFSIVVQGLTVDKLFKLAAENDETVNTATEITESAKTTTE